MRAEKTIKRLAGGRRNSLFSDVVRRYMRNPAAVIGGGHPDHHPAGLLYGELDRARGNGHGVRYAGAAAAAERRAPLWHGQPGARPVCARALRRKDLRGHRRRRDGPVAGPGRGDRFDLRHVQEGGLLHHARCGRHHLRADDPAGAGAADGAGRQRVQHGADADAGLGSGLCAAHPRGGARGRGAGLRQGRARERNPLHQARGQAHPAQTPWTPSSSTRR